MGTGYNPRIVTDGLIFALDAANPRCYAGTGLTAYDLRNSSYTGSLQNNVGFGTSNIGSFNFNGSNSYITFQPNSIFNMGTGDFTVLAWHKTTKKSDYTTIMAIDDGNGTGIILYTTITSGVLRNWVAGSPKNGNIDICTGTWNLVGLVRASGTCTQYVNAVSDATFAAAGSLTITGRSLTVGQNAGTYYYNGDIAQVQIYNRALSVTEIRQMYNATKGRYGL